MKFVLAKGGGRLPSLMKRAYTLFYRAAKGKDPTCRRKGGETKCGTSVKEKGRSSFGVGAKKKKGPAIAHLGVRPRCTPC